MPRMRAVQVAAPGGDWQVVEREIPEPGAGQVRVKVEACGVCHSDVVVKEGLFPGLQYPRIPGHEVAGCVDALGPNAGNWQKGQRVGVGWHGGHCFRCEPCRRGDFILCQFEKITGVSHDGGYAEYMIAPAESLAAMPDDLRAAEAAPLLCAGITTFNALRNAGARPGDTVAIQGIGGLGHLAIQFANRMGFRTVAIGRGKDKDPLARKLGAHLYVDGAVDPAGQLKQLGGAKVILATAPDSKSIAALAEGLAPSGKLLIVAVPNEAVTLSVLPLVIGRRSFQGWPSGTAMDSEDTLRFSVMSGVRPMIEQFPLDRAGEAFSRMMKGDVRFRAVLTMK